MTSINSIASDHSTFCCCCVYVHNSSSYPSLSPWTLRQSSRERSINYGCGYQLGHWLLWALLRLLLLSVDGGAGWCGHLFDIRTCCYTWKRGQLRMVIVICRGITIPYSSSDTLLKVLQFVSCIYCCWHIVLGSCGIRLEWSKNMKIQRGTP